MDSLPAKRNQPRLVHTWVYLVHAHLIRNWCVAERKSSLECFKDSMSIVSIYSGLLKYSKLGLESTSEKHIQSFWTKYGHCDWEKNYPFPGRTCVMQSMISWPFSHSWNPNWLHGKAKTSSLSPNFYILSGRLSHHQGSQSQLWSIMSCILVTSFIRFRNS